jgi:two-component sensor histidine kinase
MLSVIDDGVGMPVNPVAKPGLRSSIVQALAAQLRAAVEITDSNPGTAVSVIHTSTNLLARAGTV